MKIGLITAYYSEEFGGNEYYLAKELTKKGHEVFIYVSRFTPQRFGLKRTKKGSSLKNIHVIRLPSIGIKKWGLLFLWGLKKQIINVNLDAVHVQEWFMPLILGCTKHDNLVITQRLGNKNRSNILFRSYCRILYGIIKKKIKFQSVLTSEAEELFLDLTQTQKRPTIIPNGVDIGKFHPNNPIYRKKYLDHEDQILILAVGRLAKEKGFDILIDAVSRIKLDYKLLIVGSGSEENSLKGLVYKKRLTDKIIFINKIEHEKISYLYSSADFLVAPSRNEPFGFVSLESMACGTPVVASNTGGMKDIITDNVGIKFQPENIKQLRRAIVEMAVHHKNYSDNCVKYIKKNYSWDLVTERYLKLYLRGKS